MTDYNRLVGLFIDTNEHLELTDGSVPTDKFKCVVVHWHIGSAGVAAIKAVHPNTTVWAYQDFGAMIAGPHTNSKPTTLVTQEEARTHGVGADSWNLHAATVNITSSTNATPPVFTTGTAHGLAVDDLVDIAGHSISAHNKTWKVKTVPTGTTVTFKDPFTGADMAAGGAGTGGTLAEVGTYCDYLYLAWAHIGRSSWRTQASSHFAGIAADGFDGVFLDDVNTQHDNHCWSDGMFTEFADIAAYRVAVEGAMAVLTPAAHAQGLDILGNVGVNPWDGPSYNSYTNLLSNLDAAFREFWTNWNGILNDPPFTGGTWVDVTKMLTAAEAAGADFYANNYQLNPVDHYRALEYGLASFYLLWNGTSNSGFGYNDGQPTSIYGRYRTLIGAPTETKQLVAGTSTDGAWIRRYSGGVVIANTRSTAGEVSFILGGNYLNADGVAVSTVNLFPGYGQILLVEEEETGGGDPGAAGAVFFDGVKRPRVQVLAGFGGTLDPGAGYIHLGVGPGLGTGLLSGAGAGTNEVDITSDVQSISISQRGRSSDIDAADPVTCRVVLRNLHGRYDPSNPASPYVLSVFAETGSDTQPTLNYIEDGTDSASSSGCVNAVGALVTGGSTHDMGGASAATPNGTDPAVPRGVFTFWNDLSSAPGSYEWGSVRWKFRPDLDTQSVAGYYWATQGFLNAAGGGAGSVWYAGLQSRGSLSGNPKALNFAIWDAVAAVAGDLVGTLAQPFSGEGSGYQVIAPYTWTAGRTYSFVFTPEPTRGDRWFALHIRDDTTGAESWLGSIQANTSNKNGSIRGVSYQFSELFSQVTPATTCPLLPRSTVFFGTPTFSQEVVAETLITDGTPLRVRVSWNDIAYDRFYGELSDILMDLQIAPSSTVTFEAADGLEKLGRAYLPQVSPTRDGDLTGARIGWLADQAAYPSSLRAIDTGYTTLPPTVAGEMATELMRRVENTEFGLLFVDGSGRLVFYERHRGATAARSTTVQAIFGDTGVRIPALQQARSRARTFNRVAITRDPVPQPPPVRPEGDEGAEDIDDNPVEQVADDFALQATKGVLAFPTEAGQLSRNDFEALALAQYLVGRFKTTTNRISEIQANALRGNWSTLLALGPLDRVAVVRDYGPSTVSTQLQIQGVAEEIAINPPQWDLTFTTSPPPPTPTLFRLGTGQLGSSSNGKLGW